MRRPPIAPRRRQDHDWLAWLVETFAYARVVDKDSRVLGLAAAHADSSIMLDYDSVLVEVVEHVVEYPTRLTGANVRAKLEIDADVADGVLSKIVVDGTENARTLKFSDFGFEEE